VLPSKLFYGNNVPGCLVVLNKRKAPERKGKILLIWASRHYQSSNPQNILRRADCLRVIVPWRAFGDPEKCIALIPRHEQELIADIEHERDNALQELEEAYAPFLASLPDLKKEFAVCDAVAKQKPPKDKEALKVFRAQKKKNTARLKELKRSLKAMEKLGAEAEDKKAAVRQQAEREIAHARETAADLARICADPKEACRYFVVANRVEVDENEFNLNLPRYVDTFEPEEKIEIDQALSEFANAEKKAFESAKALRDKISTLVGAS